jgi:D-3-phosphoglycerate dehydrogenase
MKDGVGIVNCARGGVIDEVALVKALERKVLFAGLDVLKANQNLK